MLKYSTGENYTTLGMTMLETAVVVDYGKYFSESCCTLRGDSVMIMRVSAVFERLEATIGNKCPLVKVHNVVDKALELILKSKALASQKKRLAEQICHAAFLELSKSKDKITVLQ